MYTFPQSTALGGKEALVVSNRYDNNLSTLVYSTFAKSPPEMLLSLFLESWGMNRWVMWCHPLLRGFLVHRRSETYVTTFRRRRKVDIQEEEKAKCKSGAAYSLGWLWRETGLYLQMAWYVYTQIYSWGPDILHHTCTLMLFLITILIKEIIFHYVKFYIFKHVLIVANP